MVGGYQLADERDIPLVAKAALNDGLRPNSNGNANDDADGNAELEATAAPPALASCARAPHAASGL